MYKKLLTFLLALPFAMALYAAEPSQQDSENRAYLGEVIDAQRTKVTENANLITANTPIWNPMSFFEEFKQWDASIEAIEDETWTTYFNGTLSQHFEELKAKLAEAQKIADKINELTPAYCEYSKFVTEAHSKLGELANKAEELKEICPGMIYELSQFQYDCHDCDMRINVFHQYPGMLLALTEAERLQFKKMYNDLLELWEYMYQAAHADRIRANEEAYNSDLQTLEALISKFNNTYSQMQHEYPGVNPIHIWNKFKDAYAKAQKDIEAEKKRADETEGVYVSPVDVAYFEALIQEIIDYCKTSGIESVESSTVVVEYYTPAGVRTECPVSGNIYIVRYSDGSVRKMVMK